MTALVIALAALVATAHLLQLVAVVCAALEVRRQRRVASGVLRDAAEAAGELPGLSVVVPVAGGQVDPGPALDALFAARYPHLEVIAVVDSAAGNALEVLADRYDLEPIDPRPRAGVPTQHVRAIFAAPGEQRLVVIDKRGGDLADAWNAGLDVATQPLLLSLASLSLLEWESLANAALPFALDPATLIVTASARPTAGGGRRVTDVPTTIAGGWQHLHAARRLHAALALNRLQAQVGVDAALVIGARQALLQVGGFQPHADDPAADLAIRLHAAPTDGDPSRILHSAIAVAAQPGVGGWSELARGGAQRYQSLVELLGLHGSALGRGSLGRFALPPIVLRLILPFVETLGWLTVIAGVALGVVALDSAVLFVAACAGLGLAASLATLLLDLVAFGERGDAGTAFRQVVLAFLEQLGPRQLLHLAEMRAAFASSQK